MGLWGPPYNFSSSHKDRRKASTINCPPSRKQYDKASRSVTLYHYSCILRTFQAFPSVSSWVYRPVSRNFWLPASRALWATCHRACIVQRTSYFHIVKKLFIVFNEINCTNNNIQDYAVHIARTYEVQQYLPFSGNAPIYSMPRLVDAVFYEDTVIKWITGIEPKELFCRHAVRPQDLKATECEEIKVTFENLFLFERCCPKYAPYRMI